MKSSCAFIVALSNGRYIFLTLCMLKNLHALLSSADFFSGLAISFGNIHCAISVKHFGSRSDTRCQTFLIQIRHSVSNILDPNQAGHFFWPDLGPNCLQRLTADDTGE